MIKIKDLHVETDNKEILKGINLELDKGKVYALIGPNGSGKSTLANTIMGNPKYKITKGKIIFNNKDITSMSVSERAKLGIFMSFQNPIEINGVPTSAFLRQAHNSTTEKKASLLEFKKMVEKESKSLNMKEEFLSRYVNEGFSGGEKRLSEVLQMLVLSPKFVIFDEVDSGLDVESLKRVSNKINSFMNEEKTILIITHHAKILDYVKLDKIFLIVDGKIIKEGDKKLIKEIENKGYK
ncbi:Fe-S cluster assembly ATPase SufC [Candidatus Pacearchaeota archaeon]|nr:Fe-S cluster assembly ATPase SufC [Candidatus Pacearchaeota archaeon]